MLRFLTSGAGCTLSAALLSCLVSEVVNPTRALAPLPFFIVPLAVTIIAAPLSYALAMILLRRVTLSRFERQPSEARLALHAALIAWLVIAIATAWFSFVGRRV